MTNGTRRVKSLLAADARKHPSRGRYPTSDRAPRRAGEDVVDIGTIILWGVAVGGAAASVVGVVAAIKDDRVEKGGRPASEGMIGIAMPKARHATERHAAVEEMRSERSTPSDIVEFDADQDIVEFDADQVVVVKMKPEPLARVREVGKVKAHREWAMLRQRKVSRPKKAGSMRYGVPNIRLLRMQRQEAETEEASGSEKRAGPRWAL